MADRKISELDLLDQVDVQANADFLVIADVSSDETKKLTPAAVVFSALGSLSSLSVGGTISLGSGSTSGQLTSNGAQNLFLTTNSGTNSGTITINQGVNGNIELLPNGTGDVLLSTDTVRIGDNGVNATLTTNGTGDLILNTNSGPNAASVTLANIGVVGAFDISPVSGFPNSASRLMLDWFGIDNMSAIESALTVSFPNTTVWLPTTVNGYNLYYFKAAAGTMFFADNDSGSSTWSVGSPTFDLFDELTGGAITGIYTPTLMISGSSSVRIYDGVNGNIDITTDGTGVVNIVSANGATVSNQGTTANSITTKQYVDIQALVSGIVFGV